MSFFILSYLGYAYVRGPNFLKGPFLPGFYLGQPLFTTCQLQVSPFELLRDICMHPFRISDIITSLGGMLPAISNIPDAAPEVQARERKRKRGGREREYVSILENVILVIRC